MKLASFFIGFALRLLAYCCADYIDIISDVIVGPSSSSTDFLEELFLLQFKTNSNGTISNILSLLDSSGINRISCFFIAILVQIMSCLLFSHPNSKKQRNDELSVWLLYWNHPLMIVSSVLSPMVSIRHCLLLVCYINACNGCIPLVAISLFLLCYCQANYCLIIPGVMFLCWRGVYPFYLKCLADISPLSPTAPYLLVFSWCVVATFTCTIVLFGILLIVQLYGLVNSLSFGYFEAVVVTVSEHIDINSLPMLLQDIANLLIPFYQSFPCYEVRLITSPVHPTFQPSVGILWYLHAQLFPTYQDYFQCLWAYQPVAIVLALLSRFGGILDKEMARSKIRLVKCVLLCFNLFPLICCDCY